MLTIYRTVLAERSAQKQARAFLDPLQVAEWTGLSGRDFGALMARLRTEAAESFDRWRADPNLFKTDVLRLAEPRNAPKP